MKGYHRFVTLMAGTTFLVLVVTGLLAFFLPFSILVTGAHSLMGFVFIALIYSHVQKNFASIRRNLFGTIGIVSISATLCLTALFVWQPKPVEAVLRLSKNVGATLDRFQMTDAGFVFNYTPAENFKLQVDISGGSQYDFDAPPSIAIWLENRSAYHIHTLHTSGDAEQIPYWNWKREEYLKAKEEYETNPPEADELDAISGATPNSSFDAKDYILPERNTEPFYMLIEVNQKGDANEHYKDQPSIIYRVEIDNALPQRYQVFEIYGYATFESENEAWEAYYPDETITSALEIVDSALLTIKR